MGAWTITVLDDTEEVPDEPIELLRPPASGSHTTVVVAGNFPIEDSWFVNGEDPEWWSEETPSQKRAAPRARGGQVIMLPPR